MAYAYDRIMGSLGLTDQDENAQIPTGTPAPSDTIKTSSTEGDLSGGQGGGSSPTSSGMSAVTGTESGANSARARVLSKNAQKAMAPADLGKMQNQVQQARQGIQNEANAYIQAADDPYEVSREQLQGDIRRYEGGDKSNLDWLTRAKTAPSLVDPLQLKTDTNVQDLGMLGTDAGIKQLFRRGQDYEGTAGEAALDASLLRKNVPFQLTRDALTRDYQNLQKEKLDAVTSAQQAAQKARESGQQSYKDMINQLASEELGKYDVRAKEAEKAYNQGLSQAEAARRAQLDTQAEELYNKIKAENPDIPAWYFNKPKDFGEFYTPNFTTPEMAADSDSWKDFISTEDAAGFNRIMELLGGDQNRLAGSKYGLDPASKLGGGFDRNKFAAAVLNPAKEARAKYLESERVAAEESKKKSEAEEAQKRSDQQYKKDIEAGAAEYDRKAQEREEAKKKELLDAVLNPGSSLVSRAKKGLKF